jgi:hypothetical protein
MPEVAPSGTVGSHERDRGLRTRELAWSVDDCISSVRVTPGWRATLYRDDDFTGDHLDINLQLVAGRCDHQGIQRLHNFNPAISTLSTELNGKLKRSSVEAFLTL